MGQDGVEQAAAGAETEDLPALRERMALIKKEVTAEVEEKWVTPYRTPEVFDLKVNSRLAAHPEYRRLQERVRGAERAQSDKAAKD